MASKLNIVLLLFRFHILYIGSRQTWYMLWLHNVHEDGMLQKPSYIQKAIRTRGHPLALYCLHTILKSSG